MDRVKYIVTVIFILLTAGVIAPTSAFHIDREQISVTPDSLTTQENATISELIRFEYLNGSTFPKDHSVRCQSDLDEAQWTYDVIVDGRVLSRGTIRAASFTISGFVLSYPEHTGQSMKINLTVEGKVPEEPVGTAITLIRVRQLDPAGAPLPESHYAYLKEGRITQKFIPPTPAPASTPAPAPTILFISSTPEGALVFVDGAMGGTTPCTIRDIRAGEHIVSINLTGYHAWSSSIDVEGSKTTRISAILHPIAKEDGIPVIGGIIEAITGIFSGSGDEGGGPGGEEEAGGIPVIGGIVEFITGFFSGGDERARGDLEERLARLAELEIEDDSG